MLRILFVDDEPNVLQATRRATRDMRDEWEMHFAHGGEEALAMVAIECFDVVVSDMRMPGMDGAQLLSAIRIDSPATARVILSGYAEEQAVFRSTRVAHQFLSKPCDVTVLKKIISDIRSAQQAVTTDRVRDLVGAVDQLPALGDVYERLTAAVESDRADHKELAHIVSDDVALSAELLRLVNSAFFGLNRRAESVAQAIGFLGIDVLRAVVAGYSVFNSGTSTLVDVNELSRRGQRVAALARRTFSTLFDGSAGDLAEVFLAGMLHEVGALVLAVVDGVDPVDVQGVLGSNDVTNERLTFGADRYSVGSYLLGLWGFSPAVTQAVNSLGQPLAVRAGMSPMSWALSLARHMVDGDLSPPEDEDDPSVLNDLIVKLDQGLRQDVQPIGSESRS